MDFIIKEVDVKEIIPNVVAEVDGEVPLYDKLMPYLDEAVRFVEANFIPREYTPDASLQNVARVIIVLKAFKAAVPSLDLVLTPNGFGIVSTSAIAPASRERVEGLVSGLMRRIDDGCVDLINGLVRDAEWCNTDVGRWWCATFLCSLSDGFRFRKEGETLLETYTRMRELALRFEVAIAREELGFDVLARLHSLPDDMSPEEKAVISSIRDAELRYVAARMGGRRYDCPDEEHEIWHLSRPVITLLKRCPELLEVWEAETFDNTATTDEFKNDIKGGYFF